MLEIEVMWIFYLTRDLPYIQTKLFHFYRFIPDIVGLSNWLSEWVLNLSLHKAFVFKFTALPPTPHRRNQSIGCRDPCPYLLYIFVPPVCQHSNLCLRCLSTCMAIANHTTGCVVFDWVCRNPPHEDYQVLRITLLSFRNRIAPLSSVSDCISISVVRSLSKSHEYFHFYFACWQGDAQLSWLQRCDAKFSF